MLQFFRKYQKYFFFCITIVIVMTFLFFGTYQAIAPGFYQKGEEKSYLSQMADFINTEQWMISRKFFASNFLNDGVISKDFLETGMADLLFRIENDRLEKAFSLNQEKEKNYKTYKHPYIPNLSADMLWSLFAPELPVRLKAFQENPKDFKLRKDLFLAQKEFPPAFLSQVVRYQEKDSSPHLADPRLQKEDIALFGYQNMEDWFGSEFVKTIAEQIIQCAQLARKLGYKISKEELLSELVSRSQEVYQGVEGKLDLPISDGYGLFQLYLVQTGLTEEKALKIWEDVSLFRRLLHSVGTAALIDPVPLSDFYAFAYENATIELYQMPKEFRFRSLEELKQFEVYLAAVVDTVQGLALPLEYAPLTTIEERAPELLAKRYRVAMASVTKSALQSKVSIKETLNWELNPSNWTLLSKRFPELAQKKGDPFDLLEGLDPKVRKLVDIYAREQIVEEHPEWIEETLSDAKLETKELLISLGIDLPFEGITDVLALSQALDQNEELRCFTQDNVHFYRFLVEEKDSNKHIITFKVAQEKGLLKHLLEKNDIEARIAEITKACPDIYQEAPHTYRFVPYMLAYQQKESTTPLVAQFHLEKREKTITRSETSFIDINEVFASEKGALSSIKVDPVEGAFFYRLIDHKNDTTLPLDKMMQSQDLLSKEARCLYFEQILRKCKVEASD